MALVAGSFNVIPAEYDEEENEVEPEKIEYSPAEGANLTKELADLLMKAFPPTECSPGGDRKNLSRIAKAIAEAFVVGVKGASIIDETPSPPPPFTTGSISNVKIDITSKIDEGFEDANANPTPDGKAHRSAMFDAISETISGYLESPAVQVAGFAVAGKVVASPGELSSILIGVINAGAIPDRKIAKSFGTAIANATISHLVENGIVTQEGIS